MSWGERSCATNRSLCNPSMLTCNVDCPNYKWDGVTEPDSQSDPDRQSELNILFDLLSDIDGQIKLSKRFK